MPKTLARFVEPEGLNLLPLRQDIKKAPGRGFSYVLAEREGFEPSKGYKPLLVFKTSAFNRSATSPVLGFAPRIVLANEPKHNISV